MEIRPRDAAESSNSGGLGALAKLSVVLTESARTVSSQPVSTTRDSSTLVGRARGII